MSEKMICLPMVPLRGMTIMPEMVVHFDVSRPRSIEAVQEAMQEEQEIFLVTQKSVEIEDPGMDDVYEIGIVAKINQIIKLPKHISRILVTGKKRARLIKVIQKEPYMEAETEVLEDGELNVQGEIALAAMIRNLKEVSLKQ